MEDPLFLSSYSLNIMIVITMDTLLVSFQGHICNLLKSAIQFQSTVPILKPTNNFLSPPGGALRHFLATNQSKNDDNQSRRVDTGFAVYGIDVSSDKRHAVLGKIKRFSI